MGIEPFLVSTSVHLICAQRLVRRVCRECKEPFSMPAQAMEDIGFASDEIPRIKLFKGAGCQTCNNTGYKGRVGLYEVMEVSDGIRELILCGASSLELKKRAEDDGMINLRQSGLTKIKDGVTTVEEVVRETVL
jgi:type IV pilus assembly protein PilB